MKSLKANLTISYLLLAVVVSFGLTSCKGLKDAFSAHTSTVARVGDQELSVTRVGNLIGNSKVPVRKEVASAIAGAWVDYQLLAQAATKGDSLNDPKEIDAAMWAAYSNIRAQKLFEEVSKTWQTASPAAAAEKYNSGEILAASHILIKVDPNATPEARDSALKRAESVRSQVSSANFGQMAKQYSSDGSARNGGNLGLFPRGMMVPAFEQALLALKPGEISPVVETQFGYHIIRRPTLAEVEPGLFQAAQQQSMQEGQKQFIERLEKEGKLEMKKDIVATIRALASNPDGYRNDNTVIATSTAGKFTAGRMVAWLDNFPPQQQIYQRIITAPDSVLPDFAKNFARNDLVLKEAEKRKITVTPQETAQIRGAFAMARDNALQQLGLTQAALAEGGNKKDGAGESREHMAASRVESYVDNMVADKVPFVDITAPVRQVLRDKYSYTISQSGLERAVQQAQKVRAKSDSSARATQVPSAVPMPTGPSGTSESNAQQAPEAQ